MGLLFRKNEDWVPSDLEPLTWRDVFDTLGLVLMVLLIAALTYKLMWG